MTTLDPVTLTTAKEPIRTLARHRRIDGKMFFAVHLVPETSGRISVGDAVRARVITRSRRAARGR